jgi:glycosyltransferase involved in cell wall biosynthesis
MMKWQKNLVSVIIPAYNAAKSIKRCIESALTQTYKPTEIIVVNDGSTDATEDIVKSFGERIICTVQENQGETAARNKGFSFAKGEFITFIDHDDYWHPEFISSCVDFLRTHTYAVAVSVGSEHRSALKDYTTYMPSFLADKSSQDREAFVIDNFFDFWATNNHICAGSVMLRHTLIEEAGGQRTDLALSGDLEYWAYLGTFGKWGFIPLVLLFVDGTQLQRGNLYMKFYERYSRCSAVESWQTRIIPRLKKEDWLGFERVRGRVAIWYVFAKVFVRKDLEAFRMAKTYKDHLDGKFGKIWKAGISAGWLSWKPLCILVRLRTRIQYYFRGRRL